MDRQIARLSYWIGLVCLVVSVVWRVVMMVAHAVPEKLGPVSYTSFWKVGGLLLLLSIASVNYAWLEEKKT